MRHAPCAIAALCVLAMVVETESLADPIEPTTVAADPGEPDPTSSEWYGLTWESDPATSALLPSVKVTSPAEAADQTLVVTVFGVGVERSWKLGPFAAGGAVFSVPIDLQSDANAAGLVQVFVRLDVTDPATGELQASRRTRPAFVLNAGVAGETWYDETTAESLAVRNLPVSLAEGTVVEGLVGLEVAR